MKDGGREEERSRRRRTKRRNQGVLEVEAEVEKSGRECKTKGRFIRGKKGFVSQRADTTCFLPSGVWRLIIMEMCRVPPRSKFMNTQECVSDIKVNESFSLASRGIKAENSTLVSLQVAAPIQVHSL